MLHIITHARYQPYGFDAHGIQRNCVCAQYLPDCLIDFYIFKMDLVDLIVRERDTSFCWNFKCFSKAAGKKTKKLIILEKICRFSS